MGRRGLVGIIRGLGGDRIFWIDDSVELCIWGDLSLIYAWPLAPGTNSIMYNTERRHGIFRG